MSSRLVLPILLVGCAAARVPAAAPMAAFEANGYALSGAEYWPYVGPNEPRYPEDILWGFYPKKGELPPGESDPNAADASPAAIACAERSYGALRAFVASDPPELRLIVEGGAARGYTNRFYLWTNDYSRATSPFPPGVRAARLWYWKRKTPAAGRPPGYWKWEATLTQTGDCQVPSAESVAKALADGLADMRSPRP